jgi:hypothetical protein
MGLISDQTCVDFHSTMGFDAHRAIPFGGEKTAPIIGHSSGSSDSPLRIVLRFRNKIPIGFKVYRSVGDLFPWGDESYGITTD